VLERRDNLRWVETGDDAIGNCLNDDDEGRRRRRWLRLRSFAATGEAIDVDGDEWRLLLEMERRRPSLQLSF